MVTKGICLAKLSLCGYGIIMRRTYILFSFFLMACLLLGGCGLLFGDAAGELRDDGGTKMPAAQGERIPYKLSIEVDGERRATADEKRAAATDPDGESEGVSLGGSPEEGDEAGPAAPQADAPHREGTGAAPSAPKGNSGLSDKMRDLSQLEQLRSDPPDSLLALERRARGDVETAVKLLHSQGYYDGTATFQMDSTTKPVTVRLHLTPGPRYVLGRASVRYEPVPVVPAALKHGKRRAPYSGLGALWGDEAREATPPPRFPDTLRGVTPGEPVTADQMLEAVEKLPERLRRRGYPLAQVSSQRYFLDRPDPQCRDRGGYRSSGPAGRDRGGGQQGRQHDLHPRTRPLEGRDGALEREPGAGLCGRAPRPGPVQHGTPAQHQGRALAAQGRHGGPARAAGGA